MQSEADLKKPEYSSIPNHEYTIFKCNFAIYIIENQKPNQDSRILA